VEDKSNSPVNTRSVTKTSDIEEISLKTSGVATHTGHMFFQLVIAWMPRFYNTQTPPFNGTLHSTEMITTGFKRYF